MTDEELPFRCPRAACDKRFALDNQLQGHIGGAHARKRQSHRPIKHGTAGGYRSHQRQGLLPACKKCRVAWATYIRTIKKKAAKRKAQGTA